MSNLSDAIKEVEASEKNNPKLNKRSTIKKIVLSIFFHHP